MDTGFRGSRIPSATSGKVSGCLTATLTFAPSEENVSACVRLFFGLAAFSQAVPSAAPVQLQIHADFAQQDEWEGRKKLEVLWCGRADGETGSKVRSETTGIRSRGKLWGGRTNFLIHRKACFIGSAEPIYFIQVSNKWNTQNETMTKAGQTLWPLMSSQSLRLSWCVCHARDSACVHRALSIMALLCFLLSLLYSLCSDRTSSPLPFIISLVLVLTAISNWCQQLSDTTACFFTTLSSACRPFPSTEPHRFNSLHLPALPLWMSSPSRSGWPATFKALPTSSGHFSSQPHNLQTGLCASWQVRKLAK